MDPFTPGYGEFQGIPKRTLPDDTIQYSLYIPAGTTNLRASLEKVKDGAEQLVQEWGKDYIWQREGFGLGISESEGLLHLSGQTEFGDSIEDEWFIVAILRELSIRYKELWLRVVDTDGEFLLIEAANTLPTWVKPEIMDHRAWINSGQLLLVAERNATTAITLKEALDIIRSQDKSKIQRVRLVEEEAFYRVSKYPAAARDHLHYAIAKVPRKVALVLSERPQYISAAVEQFYLRDPISLKACKTMKVFNPKDGVRVSIKFTKVLYAQLRSQEFDPPMGSGFTIPHTMEGVRQSKEFIEADVGMKVACGFEMLMASESVKSSKEEVIAEDIRGIFASKEPPTDEIISRWPTTIDPDDWLDIDYTEFEQNLQGKSGKGNKSASNTQSSGYGHKAAEENLKKMVERFEKFLNDDSAGMEGVDIDEDMTDEEDTEDEDEEDKGVSFDEAEFEKMMREMMGLPQDQGAESTTNKTVENEEEEIRKVMGQVEAELKDAGVIERLDKPRIKEFNEDEGCDEEMTDDDEDGEVNIDFNLAKNLLESFKSQGGVAGPGGNLLASMGIVLPSDEGEQGKGKGKERERLQR